MNETEQLATAEPKHYTMQAEPEHVAASQTDPAAVVPAPAPMVRSARQIAMMKWLIQLEQRRFNPAWLGRVRPSEHREGATMTATPRGSRIESSRRKARRTLGTLSGRQWVKARKLIRRAVRAQQAIEEAARA